MQEHEQLTIAEYQATAESFREGTWDHDVSQNRDALVAAMPKNPGKILDLGCGPGRDLLAFKRQGHTVIGLDATPAFVEMARQAADCEVWQQSFFNLDLPPETFDGIFANASLLHVPHSQMVKVLKDLHQALVPGGAIIISICRGDSEGYSVRPTGYRFVSGWEYETLAPCLEQADFEILHHYYRPPGLPCEAQSWLVMVARRRLKIKN
ncbi:class I SAM-dependent methyltransferase [Coleofasciculus sp. FACHB-712]|uniref:class I SAM-dependent methyltransferase n=2 Tax=Cyanophyceae TaxID=3028117 RepID=UPI001684CD0C|nr:MULTISPECIES: class I SAM-dependent methyltransferase [unclassified Coleofasciculus]MBD1894193.1 class I SAM-dependent methyltransferase [Coleofasciculus sp. FACHB-129]MBD1945420.1 class I SAM-dependent methyltransferase [Coleofasciculus sp. FACHB-712]